MLQFQITTFHLSLSHLLIPPCNISHRSIRSKKALIESSLKLTDLVSVCSSRTLWTGGFPSWHPANGVAITVIKPQILIVLMFLLQIEPDSSFDVESLQALLGIAQVNDFLSSPVVIGHFR